MKKDLTFVPESIISASVIRKPTTNLIPTDMYPEIERFAKEVTEYRNERTLGTLPHPVGVVRSRRGRKFAKLAELNENNIPVSAWGFVALGDGVLNGVPYRKGDLFMAASWSAPAKHARGNILDGTAQWHEYGPLTLIR